MVIYAAVNLLCGNSRKLGFLSIQLQTVTYLDASVNLAYTLLRMLERWSKGRGNGEVYVRKKARSKKKKALIGVDGMKRFHLD